MSEGKMKIAIIGCGARGKDAYANVVKKYKDSMEIVAAVDCDTDKLKEMQQEYGIPAECCYTDTDDFLSMDKVADVAFICTMDKMHYHQAIKAMEQGYHLLLEKPISPYLKECVEIEKAAQKYQRHVVVCHVLRYTPFYRKIKELMNSGVVGDPVSVQAIEAVSYWHQAHSFVRGNWRNSEETSPMILQKCCHDFDILFWLLGKKCKKVSSFGDLRLFKEENAPEGAPARCLDGCPHSEMCPYYAPRYYVAQLRGGNAGWPMNVLNSHPTEENIMEELKTGPYGRCVYHCDNNVVDHQVVNMLMEDGSTIDFTMCAFTKDSYRKLRIMGTLGEIEGDMEKNEIIVKPFVGEKTCIDVNQLADDFSGHGGGEIQMIQDLYDLVMSGISDKIGLSSVEQSMISHYAAFAAEESRVRGGEPIDIESYVEGRV